ncbi:cytochrome c (plasmid) [Cupriavidus pinatubonensis]|uniref:c-type cytochrome n=1 Tax=Cupriavidus pinatubonensis TaxID=248026 RepID=UPI001C7376FE|nr:cytochrome c [Cupriavidus pinatubonensis]QYY33530.1 cytochrome c [Cupriavidus pinatubonensis]
MRTTTKYIKACLSLVIALGVSAGAGAQELDAGKTIFAKNCAVCHQASGQGQDGLAPALTAYPARYASTEGGRALLANIALYGLLGAIQNGGKQYNGSMPSFRTMSDEELAGVLSYIALDLSGGKAAGSQPISADEVKARRAQNLTPTEVRHLREQVLKDAGL